MMSEATNLETIRSAYAAFGRGDVPALMALIDAKVEWDNPGPREIPWAGSFRGHDGVGGFFSALGTGVEFEAFEPRTFVAQGDRVIVLGYERARVKRTGKTFSNHWAHAFKLAGGKVTQFHEYGDSAAVAAACREG
jgi:ketosteroid isomerase-like protein